MLLAAMSTKPSDEELVSEMVKRDAQAFATFYDRHASTVLGFLCRLLGDRSEAEEALQDAFWQVWRQAGSYDPTRGRPVAWLVQIARSRGLDRLRRVKLRTARTADLPDEDRERIPGAETADQQAIDGETQERVHTALATLPAEQRQAVTLAFFNGLTHPEIALRVNAPLGTVKTRIRLGMQKLEAVLNTTEATG
ncbi:MAG: sigma-70 family RNA polymerase sigma factor [Nitrospirota bacterium]